MHQGIVSLALMPPRRGKPHSVDRREKPRVRFWPADRPACA